MDVFGTALLNYYHSDAPEILWLHNKFSAPEEMPIDLFFRDETEMPDMEIQAMRLCKGKVLDVGAGVGSHALFLQEAGFDITALEISSIACVIMKERGIKQILNYDFFSYQEEKYDTILMLMNGIGLVGNLDKLPELLKHCKLLLKEGGQILFDSSDISYLYDDIPRPKNNYYGEISYRYKYKGIMGDWFDWLYVDKHTLKKYAAKEGLKLEILFEDENDQYLARLICSL